MTKRSILTAMLMLLAISALFFYGCEQETAIEDETLVAYYQESCGLGSVTTDSIITFSTKVNRYTDAFPKTKKSPLYQKIQNNIKSALARFNITIDDEWEDSIYIHF